MGKVVGILVMVLLAVIIIGLAQNYGWVVLFMPLGVVGAVALPYIAVRAGHWRQLSQLHQERTLRLRISELEAAQGLPLPTDGACTSCGKPLVLGAKFCSYCRAEAQVADRVCKTCGTRNASDAEWCGACGKSLLTPALTAPLYPDSSAPTTAALP